MNIKDNVLLFLEENRGKHISGASIALNLRISRNAVWKAIEALRSEGHLIVAKSNKGYCLLENSNVISAQSIEKHLKKYRAFFNIEAINSVDSTNNVLKNLALAGAKEGHVIVAGHQTLGKGRLGRSFFSPEGTGVYISLLLRPDIHGSDAGNITTAAAVATAQAIEELSGRQTQIKWVNDIYMDDKKVCGILTEAAMSLEGGNIEYAVVGIGINIARPHNGFPAELSQIADAVFDEVSDDMRSRMIASVLENFMVYYENLSEKKHLSGYRERNYLKNKEINFTAEGGTKSAVVLGIDDFFRLQIRLENGEIKYLNSGEVTIAKIKTGESND